MAFSDGSGYYMGEESDPSLCESDAPPSPALSTGYPPTSEQNVDRHPSSEPTATYPFWPEPAVEYCRSRSLSHTPEYIATIFKSDGNDSDADSGETPVSRPKWAADGRNSTAAKRRRRCNMRVWSEEDEVNLLKEMVELKKSGKEPTADLELFHQVHRFVNSDCTHTQLIGKVRRLKRKYMKIKEDPIFPTTHEERLYDLSKVVWGCVSVGDEDRSGNGCVKPSANGRKRPRRAGNGGDDEVRKKLVEYCLKYNGSLSEDMLRQGVSLMGSGRIEELDKLYKQVRMKEMEVEMMKANLLKEVLEEVCDVTL